MDIKCNFDFEKNSLVIDADGCPVAKLAASIAKEYNAKCTIVCDTAHVFSEVSGANVVTVSQGADSADFYIVNNVNENDIVVTQDYGLAAMCLAKRAAVINQDGKIYSDYNIGDLLESRAIGKKIRRSGGRTKGPTKRTAEQSENFEKVLRSMFENAKAKV